MTIRRLTLNDAEYIAHYTAVALMDSVNEPIPPFNTRSPGKLESCLAEPFTTWGGKYLHRTFIERAAVLFYLICKNHCFVNGNKRMAVSLTMCFFFVNNRWMNIPPMVLYKIACDVAESKPAERKFMHEALVKLFKKYEVPPPQV